jgi:hypothetical protein
METAVQSLPPASSPKLLDRVRQAVRTRGYSLRTEEAYIYWVRRFILYHRKRLHSLTCAPFVCLDDEGQRPAVPMMVRVIVLNQKPVTERPQVLDWRT